MNIEDYGIKTDMIADGEGIPARVTAVHRERFEAVCAYGEIFARLKTGLFYGDEAREFPTAGDFVALQYNDSGDSLILRTLPRHSFFSRKDPTPGRGEQAVAANFDYVFILSSLNQNFNIKRIERYLVAAWQSGGTPVVVLTKSDLAADYAAELSAVEQAAVGVDVVALSSHTGQGLEQLARYRQPGRTIVFLGSSGVGKSSLVNALASSDVMPVSGIREEDSRGRHTTTHRQLIMMPDGAMIIDTPGMRELGLWDADAGLTETFTDIESLILQCRFTDCAHGNEPGCAVRTVLVSGELPHARWENYQKLRREARFTEDKNAYHRDQTTFFKKVNKELRARYKQEGKR